MSFDTLRHLDEEQAGNLLDVARIANALVAKRVADAPEFLADVDHGLLTTVVPVGRVNL